MGLNGEKYTPEVQRLLRRMAINMSKKTGGAVDSDEMFSVAQHEVAIQMDKFDSAKCDNFNAWACQRAKWGIQNYLRSIDMVSRRQRVRGVKGSAVVAIDAHPSGFLDITTGNVTPPETGEQADEHRHLLARVAGLPAPMQKFLMLHFFEELTGEQIAQAMGCTKQNVSLIKQKALRALKRAYLRKPIRMVKQAA